MAWDFGEPQGALTDRSGSASTTSAQVAATNSNRRYFYFQNLDASIAVYLNFGSAATAGSGSIKIPAGGSFAMTMGDFVSTDAINVISASGTPAYTAKEA